MEGEVMVSIGEKDEPELQLQEQQLHQDLQLHRALFQSSSSPVPDQLGCKLTNEDYFIHIFEGKVCITQGSFNWSLKDKQALCLIESADKVKMELLSLTQTNIRYLAISITSFYKLISLFHIY